MVDMASTMEKMESGGTDESWTGEDSGHPDGLDDGVDGQWKELPELQLLQGTPG
jgi:hypothetical protein